MFFKNMRRNIYPGREHAYSKELKKLKSESFDKDSKDIILKWHEAKFAQAVGGLRIAKVSAQLRWIRHHSKPFRLMTQDDIQSLLATINQNLNWTPTTRTDYRRAIKQFFLWFLEDSGIVDDTKPEVVRLFKYIKKNVSTSAPLKKIDYSEIITELELIHILDKGCKNTRDKAFISMLHESGVRAEEFLNIKIKLIRIDSDCITIQIDGKTGKRMVPLFLSYAPCLRWLGEHPLNEPESYLWISTSNKNRGEPLNYSGAKAIAKKCIERSGIKKKMNLHWFRHSRATENCQELSESMLCVQMGWSQGTKQIRTYVHAGAKQVEDALRKARGLKRKEEVFTTLKCPACESVNHVTSQYCNRCGRALNKKAISRQQEIIQFSMDFFAKIQSDENLRKEFEKFKENKEKKELSYE